ncbi:MAG TPA: hypothetical protein VLL97_00180 [Acidobacteriota bacterium]|nr:hypothetical protein [Acidobacteriota bacterium]
MGAISSGIKALRIHVLGEWRIVHIAECADAIYVLQRFRKKPEDQKEMTWSWLANDSSRLEGREMMCEPAIKSSDSKSILLSVA